MTPKINIKAKISRHSRIYKDTILRLNDNKSQFSFSYKLVLIIILIFPLYPAFASIIYENTESEFYRGDIDENSIISSEMYIDPNKETLTISNSDDGSFLSVTTIGDGERNLEGSSEVIVYEVKPGESVDSIASKYGVSRNSIYRSNNLTTSSIIHPGDKLLIPPVTGIAYKIKKGDTVEAIAKEYSVKLDSLLAQNKITTSTTIIAGEYLILPDAKPPVKEPPKPATTTNTSKPTQTTTTKNTQVAQNTQTPSTSTYVDDNSGDYTLTRRAPKWKFVRGNCTRFVAQYKNVTWGGNANQWLANARAAGVATGDTPTAGAIIVFSGRNGYNPRYGHVGIVTSVGSDYLIIKDMNYRALAEVTTRRISRYDSAIMGYIYVD